MVFRSGRLAALTVPLVTAVDRRQSGMSGGNSSVDSLLKDAEKLVSRLKAHEKAADLLLGQSDGLHKTIKSKSAYMKVFFYYSTELSSVRFQLRIIKIAGDC